MPEPGVALQGKVLVLGEDERSFLSVVRSLGRAGLQVHVGWAGAKVSIARGSRYIAKAHSIPDYSAQDDAWFHALSRLLAQERFDLVIPTSDATMIPLQERRADLPFSERIYLLSDHAFEVTQDKAKTYALARSLGIPVPGQITVNPADPACLEKIAREIGAPAVFKPISSVNPSDTKTKRAAAIASRQSDFERVTLSFSALPSVLVQTYFEGIGMGLEILAGDGRVLYAYQHARVHESFGSGSAYRKGVALNPELLEATEKMVAELRYSGVAMFEFRYNLRSRQWVLLEINGRFWGSLPLAVASRADFPRYLYEMIVNRRTLFPAGYRKGLYCRNISKDFFWALKHRAAVAQGSREPQYSFAGLLAEAAKNILLLRERFDTFVLDDPAPAWRELAALARYLTNRLAAKSLRFAFLRRLSQRRPPHISAASKLLFVCKGNICRSPFAQQYVRAFYGAAPVASAGYYPVSNRRPPETAQAVAREFGVDLSRSSSRLLDEEMIASADVVIVFDHENLITLFERFTAHRAKIALLCDLVPGSKLGFVEDPYGGDADRFRFVYAQIADAVDSLFANIGVPKVPQPLKSSPA
ncbi:MAG: ATP-grasp domain-containing protein [Terracidiphilus sp.]